MVGCSSSLAYRSASPKKVLNSAPIWLQGPLQDTTQTAWVECNSIGWIIGVPSMRHPQRVLTPFKAFILLNCHPGSHAARWIWLFAKLIQVELLLGVEMLLGEWSECSQWLPKHMQQREWVPSTFRGVNLRTEAWVSLSDSINLGTYKPLVRESVAVLVRWAKFRKTKKENMHMCRQIQRYSI